MIVEAFGVRTSKMCVCMCVFEKKGQRKKEMNCDYETLFIAFMQIYQMCQISHKQTVRVLLNAFFFQITADWTSFLSSFDWPQIDGQIDAIWFSFAQLDVSNVRFSTDDAAEERFVCFSARVYSRFVLCHKGLHPSFSLFIFCSSLWKKSPTQGVNEKRAFVFLNGRISELYSWGSPTDFDRGERERDLVDSAETLNSIWVIQLISASALYRL